MRKANKIQEQKEILRDLTAILLACDSAIKACSDAVAKESLTRDLVITYEERERQFNKLETMQGA